MIGVLAKNDNLNPSANLAAGDTTVGSRPIWLVALLTVKRCLAAAPKAGASSAPRLMARPQSARASPPA
jgi:hypothetical protein